MQDSLRALRPRAVLVEMREYSYERVGHGSAPELRRKLERLGYRSTGEVLNHNEVFAPSLATALGATGQLPTPELPR